jgi:hypothetical protein
MTAATFVWKIRDKATGLYWDGFNNECSHEVGTRFVRGHQVRQTLIRINELKCEGKIKGDVSQWELVYVELAEIDQHRENFKEALNGSRMAEVLPALISRMAGQYHTAEAAAEVFLELLHNNELTKWDSLCKMSESKSWVKLKAAMEKFNINEAFVKRKKNGWYLIANPATLLILRTAGFFKAVIGIERIVEGLEGMGIEVKPKIG